MNLTTASTPASEVYQVRPYRPDGGFDASGIGVLLGVLMLAAVVMGVICHFVGQYFWLILLFPVLVGFALGTIGKHAVRFARLRNPILGAAVGLICGLTAMTTMHYGDYLQFRSTIDAEMESANPQVKVMLSLPLETLQEAIKDEPASQQQKIIKAWELMHSDSFFSFMQFSATEGVSISHHGSSGINLGYYVTWIYWLVEVMIVTIMTLILVKEQTAEPYCTTCNIWKQKRPLGSFVAEPSRAKIALESGAIAQLQQINPSAIVPLSAGLAVTMAHCPQCDGQGEMDIRIDLLSTNDKGKPVRKQIAQVTYPPEAKVQLEALFAAPEPVSLTSTSTEAAT